MIPWYAWPFIAVLALDGLVLAVIFPVLFHGKWLPWPRCRERQPDFGDRCRRRPRHAGAHYAWIGSANLFNNCFREWKW